MNNTNNSAASYPQPAPVAAASTAMPVPTNAPSGGRQPVSTAAGASAPQPAPAPAAKPIPTNVTAICHALRSVGGSTRQIADFLEANPTETRTISESAKAIAECLNDLIATATTSSESNTKLRTAAEETVKTSDWIGSHLSGGSKQPVAVTNANPFGKVVGAFNALLD